MRFAVFPYIWNVNQLNDLKQILQQLKPELVQKFHVHAIGIFGSAVKGDFSPVSDVDIIVDFNQPIGIEFIDLADYIEAQLQKKVDLVSKNGIKDKYFKAIEGEIVYV
jgi:predicted nucleotidyltransferase